MRSDFPPGCDSSSLRRNVAIPDGCVKRNARESSERYACSFPAAERGQRPPPAQLVRFGDNEPRGIRDFVR